MQIWPTMARQRLKSVKAGCFDHKGVAAANALCGDAADGGGLISRPNDDQPCLLKSIDAGFEVLSELTQLTEHTFPLFHGVSQCN